MNIFLSYASAFRPLAADLCHRLQAAGHDVFFDREDLPAGQSYDDRIRCRIEACDLFVFLVTPDAVADGRYTRTELKIATRKWPAPGWRVLPVLAAPTPLADIPAYLRALNLLQPEGNLVAEVLLEVQDRVRAQSAATRPATAIAAASSGSDTTVPNYRSLLLRFERRDGGAYCVATADMPSAELRIDPAFLAQRLWQGSDTIAGTARRDVPDALTALAGSQLPALTQAREVGQALHAALFGSALGAQLTADLRGVNPQRSEGLRFVVDTSAAPELAQLPWEFLYSPVQDDFMFSDRLTPLVRRLDVSAAPTALAAAPPLRLLVAVASPSNRPGLQVGAELAHLDQALASLVADGRLQTQRLEHTTLERLDDALLLMRPHVLHFIGHGDFDGEEGRLVLESDGASGTAAPIAGRQLAVLLRNHLGSLRLVFLNNCMGAAASPLHAFGGVAQSLLRRGMPAVVAMQFPIPDADAVQLARHFYRYLAAGHPVDAALTSARAVMVARGGSAAWGAPVLYLNAEDGRLFTLGGAAVTEPIAAPARNDGVPPDLVALPALPLALPPGTQSPEGPQLEAPRHSAAARRRRSLILAAVGVGVLTVVLVNSLANLDHAPSPKEPPTSVGAQAAPNVVHAESEQQPSSNVDAQAAPSVDVAIAGLRAGEVGAALAELEDLRSRDREALSGTRLGERHAPLALAVARAAEQAFAAGRETEGRALADVIGAMAPFAPALEARLRAEHGRWLGRRDSSATPPRESVGAGWLYTVQAGDTLWDLSARFSGDGRNWPALLRRHNERALLGEGEPIVDPNRLRAGQRLWLPISGRTTAGKPQVGYHVATGETLSLIARRVYGDPLAWRHLQQINSLPNPDQIRPGQVLRLTPWP